MLAYSKVSLPFVLGLFSFFSSTFSQGIVQEEGKIDKVTLYRKQALVTRKLELNLNEGSQEILVKKLPSQIIPSSLFAEGENMEIRAVRLKTQEVKEDPEEEIRVLDDKINKLSEEIKRVNLLLSVNHAKNNFLIKQGDFSIQKTKEDLNTGKLEPRTMKELTLFQFEQQKELALEKLDLEKERSKYYQEKNQISRQRSKLASNNLQTKEALIFIDKKTKGNSVIYLNYLVNNAGWDPVYNFHAKKDSKNVVVEFNANVHQISGENWNDISLTLSNASPALSAMSPGISPFRVELSSGSSAASMGAPNDITVQTRAISNKLSQAYQKQLESKNWKESQEYSWDMNSAANEYQGLELIANDEDINILKKDSETAFAPSVQFELDGKVSLDSKKQQQLIRVNRAELPSKLYMVSTPILTAYVYREAEIQNNAIEVLLKGPVSVYLDDSFVGKAELPVIARGQSFVMGFGIDSQLRAKRELVEKKERVMGGNKELSFNISISIENFHSTEIPVRILDRIPLDEKKDNLRISLDLKGNELSKDELYQKTEKTKGILRWEISIPANSSGAKAKNLEYSYRLEFDKNLKIQLPGSEKKEKLKQEFEEIQKMRYKY